MNGLTAARLCITGIGVAVWGYGLRVDDANLRVVGMAVLAVALLLRFARRRGCKDPAASE